MNFLLVVVQSSAIFLPSSVSYVPYTDKISCLNALTIARSYWQTVNDKSKCVDLTEAEKIKQLQRELKELKND